MVEKEEEEEECLIIIIIIIIIYLFICLPFQWMVIFYWSLKFTQLAGAPAKRGHPASKYKDQTYVSLWKLHS